MCPVHIIAIQLIPNCIFSLDFQQEFPLYAKGVEVARTDYAIFLLNKDLAQVRWLCGLVTADLKCTLRNLHELLSLGDTRRRRRQQQQQQQQHRSQEQQRRLVQRSQRQLM